MTWGLPPLPPIKMLKRQGTETLGRDGIGFPKTVEPQGKKE
jgi:hypothetical protein